jgi:PPP family 3-phenylpropionic acid transporter
MAVPHLRLAAFYFFYFATLGAFLPYWSLYLADIGFSAEAIGELSALLIVTKIISPSLIGWLADSTGQRLRVIRASTLLSSALFAGFLVYFDYAWYAAITLGFSFFWNGTLPQFEAATLHHLKKQPQRYSHIRLWGSVGFIAAVIGIGSLLDVLALRYLPVLMLSLLVANALVALMTPDAHAHHHSAKTNGLAALLTRREVLAFFVAYLLLQVSHGPYYVFYTVYLHQHGYSTSTAGLLWSLGVAAEIVLFMAVGWLLRRLGLRALLLASLGLSFIRWLLIAYSPEQGAVMVLAQLLHAASFGLAHVVAIQYLSQFFGEQHQGKGQALYSSLCFGIGGMLGSLYSGYGWETLGGQTVYVIAALASGVAFLLAYVVIGRGACSAAAALTAAVPAQSSLK